MAPERVMRVPVAEGVALHVVVREGRGAPFVLVHGLSSNVRLWDGVATALAANGHAVVALDLRGHGRSDKPDHGYDTATVAGDVATVIDTTGVERPVVVGQSWGANIALELAWRRPRLVGGVACVDGGWIELADRFADEEACWRALAPPATAGCTAEQVRATLEAMHPEWPATGIEATLACFEDRPDGTVAPCLTRERHRLALDGLWRHRPSERYGGIDAPVLLVPADEGSTPFMDAKRRALAAAEHALPVSRTAWMRGHHDLHAERPDELASLLIGAVEDGFWPG